jgi:hypothetical protein
MSQLIKRITNYLERIRFSVMINTSMYMWEPWEIRIFTTLMLAVLLMVVYAAWTYLPAHLLMLVRAFVGVLAFSTPTATPAGSRDLPPPVLNT